MRSTIDIDERLFEEAKKLTRLKTKKAVVNLSLKELIRKKRREELADLFGSSVVDITLKDLEKLREDEF
ncbi:type II toxin-antitoxin system VapB family antitoxin [Candidatus Aerophobetes bacterium]|nr:type II toxin-antitoxin system VapB family antitoxin [Candidatus Aerophobetes bacterium]